MKNLFTLAIIFVLASITLSSCKSSSVMKRRYNKGYYVHHKARHTEPKTHETAVNTRAAEPLLVAPKTTEQPAALDAGNTVTTKPVMTADLEKNKTVKNESALKNHNKGFLKSIPAEYSIKKPIKTLKNISTKIGSGHGAGEALSLLWVLIVILLVLYLVGILLGEFGLGGIFHLLGVIILVLLILWLLRIL